MHELTVLRPSIIPVDVRTFSSCEGKKEKKRKKKKKQENIIFRLAERRSVVYPINRGTDKSLQAIRYARFYLKLPELLSRREVGEERLRITWGIRKNTVFLAGITGRARNICNISMLGKPPSPRSRYLPCPCVFPPIDIRISRETTPIPIALERTCTHKKAISPRSVCRNAGTPERLDRPCGEVLEGKYNR